MSGRRYAARALFTAIVLALPLVIQVATAGPARAFPGDLDPAFDGDGKVNTVIGPFGSTANAMALQPDGKIVVAGLALVANSSDFQFAVARYNPDGTLDPSFGSGGKATTALGTSWSIATAVAIQGDGKIVLVGYVNSGSNNDFGVARFNADGTLDSSFGTGGKVTTSIGASTDDPFAVAIQSDGKIVVAGFAYINPGDADFALVRYTTNGSLDSSFGTGGKVTSNFGTLADQALSMAIQPDGKIVAAGSIFPANYDVAVARYNSNGSLDSGFGSGGLASTDIGGNNDVGNSVAIQPDGNIVVGGFTSSGTNGDFLLLRYTSGGGLDGSFGIGGIARTPIGSGNDVGSAVALQPDGRIVQAGYSNNGSDDDVAVARFISNGSLDASFGSDGKTTTSFGSGGDYADGVAIQSDGKIVTAGYTTSVSGWILTRYKGDPTLSINDVSVTEGNSGITNATFTVSLSDAAHTSVTVQYYTLDGTAKAPGDYAYSSGTLAILTGATSRTITVPVNGDTDIESNETFYVTLYGPGGATVADGTGIGTILNDDSVPGPTLTLGTSAGPPKSKFTVSGANFGPNELVDVYFDTSDQRLVSTNGAGAFSGAQLAVPGDAQPGQHWVTAVGRSSGLSAQAVFTVRADWSAYGAGPRHQGANPTENTVGANNASGMDLGWSAPISGAITTTPTVAGGLVYFGSSTFSGANFFLYAADASTGAIAWSVALPINPNDKSQPAAAGGRVYVGSSGKMEAIDTTTHAVACAASVGSTIHAAPEVSGGLVYFGADSGTLYAVDATTCATSWSAATGGAITGSPAVAGGVVWVPSGNNLKGYLVAAPHTNTVTVATGGPVTAPAVLSGYVFVGAGDNTVRAVRAADGSSVWSVTLGSPVVAGPAVAGGTVFVGTSDGHLYALSAFTGATKWIATTGGSIAGTPAVANGVVYAGSADKNLYAYDASSGSLLWQGGTGGAVTGPVVANGQVFAGSADKSLYAFSLGGQKRPGHGRPDPETLHPDLSLRLPH